MNIGINDKLDALISLTAKECGNDDVEMFNNLDTSKVSLDKRFYLKLRQIISKHKHTAAVFTLKKCLVRVAIALMALMSLGFLTIMATPDLREAIFEAVVEWYENYISIHYESVADDTHGTDTTYESIDSTFVDFSENESNIPVVVPPAKIEKVMKPTYVPEGIESEEITNKTMVVIDYYFGNDLYFTYHQTIINKHNVLFDNDTAVLREVMLSNGLATIVKFNDRNDIIIAWTDRAYWYYIELFNQSINEEELIKIADSVK